MMIRASVIAASVLIAGCAASGENDPGRTVWVPDGPAVNCINRHNIRSFNVVDDRTIEFHQNRGRMFRNELPQRCSGMSFGQAIKLNSRGSRVCSMDTFRVGSLGTGTTMPCSLGQFQPMKRAPAPEQAAG